MNRRTRLVLSFYLFSIFFASFTCSGGERFPLIEGADGDSIGMMVSLAKTSDDNDLLSLNKLDVTTKSGYYIVQKNDNIVDVFENYPNTIFEIRYDFQLEGIVSFPIGCVLKFNGGKISGPITLIGNNTSIDALPVRIFGDDVCFDGTWNISQIYTEWFGAKGDGITNCSDAIELAISCADKVCAPIRFLGNTYCISRSIDLCHYYNITFDGANVSNAPWKTRRCTIKATSLIDVMFKLVDDYPDNTIPTTAAREISIRNLYLDGDFKAFCAVNCIDAKLENLTIRHCLDDGIRLEAMTYPVVILDCVVENCGGNGLRAKSPYTTHYTVERCEFNNNDGYGLYVEGGYAGTIFKSIVIQGNKRGGIKLLLHNKETEGYTHDIYLGYLLFEGIYTEWNGLLDHDNPSYDGNYCLYVKGLNTSNTSSAGKINGLSFINCQFEPTPGNSNKIEGATIACAIGNTKFPNDIVEYNSIGLGQKMSITDLYLHDFPDSKIDKYFVDGGATRKQVLNNLFPNSCSLVSSNGTVVSNIGSHNKMFIGNIAKYFSYYKVDKDYSGASDTITLKLRVSPSPKFKVSGGERYVLGSGFIGNTHCNVVATDNTGLLHIVDDSFSFIKLNSITNNMKIALTFEYMIE